MSNTVITNYTDLNGPTAKTDSSVVVIVNKDGTLSVDQNLLDTLMGTDGTQSAISVVRVGHEGKPDDATDSENEDENIPHVTLSVDSYYDEPNSIIKYDSGAEMLQSLRIETRENSLVGFHNDHCYTPLMSSSPTSMPQRSESLAKFEEPVLEITHTPPPKPVPNAKKITIIEQQIIPKGKKILINAPTESPIILKGNDVLNKPLPVGNKPMLTVNKTKELKETKKVAKTADNVQRDDSIDSSSSLSSSGDSIPDRDSDSDYKETRDRNIPVKVRKPKVIKPRILKTKLPKQDIKPSARLKVHKVLKADVKEKVQQAAVIENKDAELDLESILPSSKIPAGVALNTTNNLIKHVVKVTPKPVKKEKKTPAHVTALLSDMTSLFSTPDVIRRVSTDNKIPAKADKEPTNDKKSPITPKAPDDTEAILKVDTSKTEANNKTKLPPTKTYSKPKDKNVSVTDKSSKSFESMPQLDEVSLAQIFQDPTSITPVKTQTQIPSASVINSPGLAGPLSPTLDLLGGLQPEEEGLTEDLLMHVAQLVESSENLQEVIDKQVLGKVDTGPAKTVPQSPFQQGHGSNLYMQTLSKAVHKTPVRKDPIEIVRRDGRVITLPPIEAPATRSSKRKTQIEITTSTEALGAMLSAPTNPEPVIPEPQVQTVSKQYLNKKLINKKQENLLQSTLTEKNSAESQESWNSEDDPNRLWCICKQPHNNRFMICCDSCEDWFHGKCVNITKAMGQQMEEQGIEWRCPNCIKKTKTQLKNSSTPKQTLIQKKIDHDVSTNESPTLPSPKESSSKTNCIVCKKSARASSIYCSDACILKHAQDSLGTQGGTKVEGETGKIQDKQKSDARVIVYERKSGRLLAGPNAPTAENLRSWLQKNPTFEVVRPGTLSTIKPNVTKKKISHEPNKIQTTLNFERIPRKAAEQNLLVKSQQPEVKEKINKLLMSPREDTKLPPSPKAAGPARPHILNKSPAAQRSVTPKTPIPKSNTVQLIDTPRPSTSAAKNVSEPRKQVKSNAANRSLSIDKPPSVSPTTSRRKDSHNKKMDSTEPIRDNVRKALQEQMSLRMAEDNGNNKFTEQEIQKFAVDTETELHDLFRDVGMKYKAKYRSLMFNIKDRKNLSLWQKICDRSITPHQLVRLSPEELASQELAEWRDQEAKHQLELIKKSELDLLAASKTYVLKTHKGEEVMENKESVSTELDPNVPVEDVVIALNDSTVGEEVTKEVLPDTSTGKSESTGKKHSSNRKRGKEVSGSRQSKKSKRDMDSRKSRSSRRKSDSREKDSKEEQRRSTRTSDKKKTDSTPESKDKAKAESKEKSDSVESSSSRRRSRDKSKKTREYSRSRSKERSQSSGRARKRSRSQSREEGAKRKRRSRSKHSSSVDEKVKHRSRSQENMYSKKNDSNDSDSLERPKSAMLKEVHPEYDPHEPMITSAFSEEDLRKSREDVFEESFKHDIGDAVPEYDHSKAFSIDSEIIMPTTTYLQKQDKSSEAESDQEPSSTVENSAATVWNGCINMVDVARFYVAAHEVSGIAVDLEEDLSTELDIVGRINPDTVWDYIGKMKKASNKDIVILRLQAANDEEKMQYIALYSYLSSRNRLGVVKVSNTTTVKDFYILPLPANTSLPAVLLPLDGPGLGDVKMHLLLAIVIRQRKKRLAPHIPKDKVPAKIARDSNKPLYPGAPIKASYTPPTSPRRRTLPFPSYTSPALSTSVKDKIAASLAAADEDEAYSPGSTDSSGSGSGGALPPGLASKTLQTKMEELNRQIEEQKQQILKMAQADSSVGEDEAYSPSRPMTPPSVVDKVPLADIALPSNLQEILATIKQRTETANSGDVDMRSMPLP
ncbi:hypothetical protein K1T71_001803 [Dendrolimus kikuchii]|uniref:Uncharacterized protein n=1 Tax=Dendrolimus kikuchii TaxID=765133 RepID=A0ACC1DEP2_9NEOP|nr:hypothetical protein K1T71_001803 [Dendrolimus kikuchii]